jgi:hypothetical protein
MDKTLINNIDDAFNSMLRTDYIPLKDTEKLQRLSRYYVDYFGYLRQIVGETDQLLVGRRGTGKTTLLYRALIECIHSWNDTTGTLAKSRTLAIYLDLSKCQTLSDTSSSDFTAFEHVFVTELVDSIREELFRNWPELAAEPGLMARIFSPAKARQRNESSSALDQLSSIIVSGIPRQEIESAPRKQRRKEPKTDSSTTSAYASISPTTGEIGGAYNESQSVEMETESVKTTEVDSRLTIADVIRCLGELREACGMSHIVILVDELSSLTADLQRRFSTLLRKILGNHAGGVCQQRCRFH